MTVWPNGLRTIPRVTSEFGPRAPIPGVSTSGFHSGIDLVGWANNKAPASGQVILASYNGGAGNEVRIRANNGDVFRILHNARFLVSYGQWVTEGQDVGVMGTTGASTGVHCHFETHPGGGAAVNPRGYMAQAVPAGGGSTPISSIELMEDEDMRVIYNVGPGYAVILPYGSYAYPETQSGNEIVAAILGSPVPALGVNSVAGAVRVGGDQFATEVREADRRLAALLNQIWGWPISDPRWAGVDTAKAWLIAGRKDAATAAGASVSPVDVKVLATQIVDGLKAAGVGNEDGDDDTAITKAVVAAISPLLAALPDQTADEIRERLTS